MPPTDTICISFGNWIVAFYIVYTMAAVALVAASAVLIDWCFEQALCTIIMVLEARKTDSRLRALW